MLLLPICWAGRVWALPFLTALAPSGRYAKEAGKRHKKVTDWARQMLLQLKRWLPGRQVIAVGDSGYAVIELLAAVRSHVTFITRLRLDAALYEPAPAREPGKPGRSRKKGGRLPTLQEVLKSSATKWQKVKLANWYGHGQKDMEIATATAVWYHSGKPVVPLRWVLLLRPGRKAGTGGPALHGPGAFGREDSHLLCQKMVRGGHAGGDTGAPGGRDPKAVVG